MSHDYFKCTRDGCNESFASEIGRERHIALDHEMPWERDDVNFPRAPEER